MNRKEKVLIFIGILFILVLSNYNFLDSLTENFLVEKEKGVVTRIIDGDTIEIGNDSIRLLGVNSPEKGERGYEEAKGFLENEILNKEVELIFGVQKYDKYYRKLAYVYSEKENICLKSVESGFSNIYFPDKASRSSKEFNLFANAWNSCLASQKGLCEKSSDLCSNCIKVRDLNLQTQEIILKNFCSFDCDISGWSVKDEGRKKYVFGNFILKGKSEIVLNPSDFEENYIWTETGDSFFIRDSFGALVSWGIY